MSNELATIGDAGKWLASKQTAIESVLPKHVTSERMMRVALTAFQKVPKLLQCSKESVWTALVKCSELGIEPDGRRAHLIPYGKECQLILDYKGIAELVRRSGDVIDIHCDVVCENDEFDENLGQITVHRINRRVPRGKPYAAYSRVTLKDGSISCEVMSADEIERVRKSSKAGNSGPWKDWPEEMWKKTVFRRHSKWLPLSPEVVRAVEIDDDLHQIRNVTPTPTATVTLGGAVAIETPVEAVEEPPNKLDEMRANLREILDAKDLAHGQFVEDLVERGSCPKSRMTIDDLTETELTDAIAWAN